MSDGMTGSDNIERTLDEWFEFILDMTGQSDEGKPEDALVEKMQAEAGIVFNDLPVDLVGDMVAEFGKNAGEWFKIALREAHDKGHTYNGKMNHLKASIEKLPRLMSKRGFKKKQRVILGMRITDYIIEHGDLPRNRNVLLEFIEARGEKMSLTSLKDNLPWYKLDKVCLTYHID